MKSLKYLILFFMSISLFSCKETNHILCKVQVYSELGAPDNIVKPGVSAPFVGILSNHLIVAGGCNFPDKPLIEGGKKEYSNQIWALNLTDSTSKWFLAGELPIPLAYGAAVSTPNSIIFLGGNNNEASYSNVFSVKFNSAKDTLLLENLTSLPIALDNFAATYINNKIYVIGGNANGNPSKSFFCGTISDSVINWQKLDDYIGACKIQPTLLATMRDGEENLFLSGGFLPGNMENPPQIPTNVLKYSVSAGTWSADATLPLLPDNNYRSLIGASAAVYNNRYLIYFGGVNYNCFYEAVDRPRQIFLAEKEGDNDLAERLKAEAAKYLHHPKEWYKFNEEIICYDVVTKSWSLLANSQLCARAGAGAVILDNKMYIVCGEEKPGIRIPLVSVCSLF